MVLFNLFLGILVVMCVYGRSFRDGVTFESPPKRSLEGRSVLISVLNKVARQQNEAIPDPCTSNRNCEDGRICVHEDPGSMQEGCREGNKGCFCLPQLERNAENEQEGQNQPHQIQLLKGVTLEHCLKTNDCSGDRMCKADKNSDALCSDVAGEAQQNCVCVPPELRTCAESSECEAREDCARLKPEDDPYCFSTVIIGTTPGAEMVGNKRPDTSVSAGLGLFPCKGNDDCRDKKCYVTDSTSMETGEGESCPAETDKQCVCIPHTIHTCTKTVECPTFGEVCAVLLSSEQPEASKPRICVSADVEAAFGDVIEVSKIPKQPLLGVTLDKCAKEGECADEFRKCTNVNDGQLCTGQTDCHCTRDPPRTCAFQIHCEPREVCALVKGVANCISRVVAELNGYELVTNNGPPPRETSSTGFTLYPCMNAACQGERDCVYDKNDDGVFTACEGSSTCFCYPKNPKRCESDTTCDASEICAAVDFSNAPKGLPDQLCVAEDVEAALGYLSALGGRTKPVDTQKPSISPTPSDRPGPEKPSPSTTPEDEDDKDPEETIESDVTPEPTSSPTKAPAEDGVCIDAELLGHLSNAELVFGQHYRAKVLCDSHGNCATPGHMVRYRGAPMMMKSYCQITSCFETEKMVNSPRYKRGLVVESKSEELVFTAFAARYETRAEEAALMAAVRVGL